MFTVSLSCSECKKSFNFSPQTYDIIGLRQIPKRCPECIDRAQNRPSIVIERRCLFDAIVAVGPTTALLLQAATTFETTEKDLPCWRTIQKGKQFGVSWSGRIDLYTYIPPKEIEKGMIVYLRDMEVRKQIWNLHHFRKCMDGSTAEWVERVPPNTEGAKMKEEVDHYVAIEPANGQKPTGTLVWAHAHSKTTIKGLGRQYSAKIVGTPIWEKRISGGVRSGRIYDEAILAIQNDDDPIRVVVKEY